VLGARPFDPTQPIRTASGDFYEQLDFNPLAPNNPVAELALVAGAGAPPTAAWATWRPLPHALPGGPLRPRCALGFDVAKSERRGFWPSILQAQVENPVACTRLPAVCVPAVGATGTVSRSNPRETNGVLDAFLNYTRRSTALDSDVDATAGYSYEDTDGDYPSFYARGLTSDLLGVNGVPTALDQRTHHRARARPSWPRSSAGSTTRWRTSYLLTLSVRRDGSSRFGPDEPVGDLPGGRAGVADERGALPERLGWLSDLKLRGFVGGQRQPGDRRLPVDHLRTYGDQFAQVQFGNEFVTTIRPSGGGPQHQVGADHLDNLGIDYGLFDDRVTGSVDYYVKDTDDLLFEVPVPAGTNLSNFVTTNIGSMRNRGLELSVNADVLDGGGGCRGTRTSTPPPTATGCSASTRPPRGRSRSWWAGSPAAWAATSRCCSRGSPVNSFYVLPHKRDANGRPVYADANGDGSINDRTCTRTATATARSPGRPRALPQPTPTWILAHTSSFGYRNLDLGFTLRAHLGNYVYNNTGLQPGLVRRAEPGGGPINLHARCWRTGSSGPQFFSDVYVEDASFLRMDNLTLGYTLPAELRHVQSMRVSRHGAERVHPHGLQRRGPRGGAERDRQQHLSALADLLARRDPRVLTRLPFWRTDEAMKTKCARTRRRSAGAPAGRGACTDITTEPKSNPTGANVFNDPARTGRSWPRSTAACRSPGRPGPAGNGRHPGDRRGVLAVPAPATGSSRSSPPTRR
jgi:hypothetical protein